MNRIVALHVPYHRLDKSRFMKFLFHFCYTWIIRSTWYKNSSWLIFFIKSFNLMYQSHYGTIHTICKVKCCNKVSKEERFQKLIGPVITNKSLCVLFIFQSLVKENLVRLLNIISMFLTPKVLVCVQIFYVSCNNLHEDTICKT